MQTVTFTSSGSGVRADEDPVRRGCEGERDRHKAEANPQNPTAQPRRFHGFGPFCPLTPTSSRGGVFCDSVRPVRETLARAARRDYPLREEKMSSEVRRPVVQLVSLRVGKPETLVASEWRLGLRGHRVQR
ncbi:hypothetical protein GN956_G17353 [Arapaima gigas]